MKYFQTLVLAILLVSVIACKKENKTQPTETPAPPSPPPSPTTDSVGTFTAEIVVVDFTADSIIYTPWARLKGIDITSNEMIVAKIMANDSVIATKTLISDTTSSKTPDVGCPNNNMYKSNFVTWTLKKDVSYRATVFINGIEVLNTRLLKAGKIFYFDNDQSTTRITDEPNTVTKTCGITENQLSVYR